MQKQEKGSNQQTDEMYDLEQYELACDAVGLALWDFTIVDGDMRSENSHVIWSQKIRQMLGFADESDFPNGLDSLLSRLHPDDMDPSIEAANAHLGDKTGQTPFNIEHRLKLKNGEYKTFRAIGTTTRDKEGVPVRFAGAFIDIDKEKKTQNQLMIMSSIVHNSPNFVSYKKLDGECLYLNPAASKVLGFTHEELKKDYLGKMFGEKAAQYASVVHKDMEEHGVASFEYETNTKSGDVKVLSGTSFFIEQDAFATIAMDTTKAKKAELGRIQAQESMMEMMESIKKSNILLQAVNHAATLLLTTRENEDITVPILESMELIGNSLDADRIHIWRNDIVNEQLQYTRAYSWFSELGKTKAQVPEVLYNSPELALNWRQKFINGECVKGSISSMPHNDQLFLRPLDVASIVIIPLFFDNMYWGLFSIDNCEREFDYTEDEINILRSVSLMLASAINRHALIEQRTHDLAIQTATLSTLIDSIPGLVFTKDLNSQFMHCNKMFSKHFGRPIGRIIGKTAADGIGLPKEIGKRHNEEDRRIIRENIVFKTEEHIPRVDGTNPIFETTKMPLILDGVTVGVMGIAYDITELKETERLNALKYDYAMKLRDSLAEITKSPAISTGDLQVTADLIVKEGCNALDANRISVWSLCETENALINYSSYDRITGEYSIQEAFDLESRPEYTKLLKTERLIVTNDVRYAQYDMMVGGYGADLCAVLDAPIRIDGKVVGVICADQKRCKEYPEKREWTIEEQGYVSSLSDLIALAISGSELKKARESAEIANQAKSSFLANMSHEIRTPMNAIIGVTDIMMQEENLPESVEEGLCRIYSSCSVLLGIINDILDFSKIEAGKLSISPAEYKAANLINDSIQLNMMQMSGKMVEFEIQVDENLPAKMIGDELRIKQILNNLLSNAFKYTEKGKVTLTVVCEAWPGEDGVTLVLIIRDTGCGISKEQLGKLFEEYSRFSQRGRTITGGTGLGLAITQSLIELMNGGINVESEPGTGSVFAVRLPQKIVDGDVLGREVVENLERFRMNYVTRSRRGQMKREFMPYGSVLIVDDVETNLYVTTGLIKPYGLQIETVSSGLEAIEKVKEGKVYDIIFMDHMMPEMDGMEATKNLRDLGYRHPVVALTANAVSGQSEIFLKNGFDEFISKPIDIRQLDTVLNEYIRDKQPPEVVKAARLQKNDTEAFVLDGHVIDYNHAEDLVKRESDARAKINAIRRQAEINRAQEAAGSGLSGREIDGLDIVSGLERYDDDEEAYLEILQLFADGVRTMLKNIGTVDVHKLPDYKMNIHGIKGACLDVFAGKIEKAANKLEEAADRGDIKYIISNNQEFLNNANRLITSIDELTNQPS